MKTAGSVDPRGQDHYRSFVENNLVLESELLDYLEDSGLMRLACVDDRSSNPSGLTPRRESSATNASGGGADSVRLSPVPSANNTGHFRNDHVKIARKDPIVSKSER
jgi:hypothetical protein